MKNLPTTDGRRNQTHDLLAQRFVADSEEYNMNELFQVFGTTNVRLERGENSQPQNGYPRGKESPSARRASPASCSLEEDLASRLCRMGLP